MRWWLVALVVVSIYTPGPPAAVDLLANRLSGHAIEWPSYYAQPSGATFIAVCCSWDSSLADGELTYSISGADSLAVQVVRNAVEEWDVVLAGFALTEVPDGADIEIRFERADDRRGKTRHTLDEQGLIAGAQLTIFGDAASDIEAVRQVAKHEIGHALGAGHADGDGDLMSPTVSGGSARISQCDIDAVIAANRWKLVDVDAVPYGARVFAVFCNGSGDDERSVESGAVKGATYP